MEYPHVVPLVNWSYNADRDVVKFIYLQRLKTIRFDESGDTEIIFVEGNSKDATQNE